MGKTGALGASTLTGRAISGTIGDNDNKAGEPAGRGDAMTEQTEMERFLKKMKGCRADVIGIGVSNKPLIELLARAGARTTACDKKTAEQLGEETCRWLKDLGVQTKLGPDYMEELEGEVIFRSPGVRPDQPGLEAARVRGSRVTSEMEVFFAVCPCPILAVTGSDGKTTTTTLIAEMLKKEGRKVWIGGNIGQPLLAQAGEMTPEDLCVVELSSFQLMTMRRSPHVAVVTNVTPNHLDVHKSMEEYVEAKENIWLHQGAEDLLVVNADNPLSAAMAERASGEVLRFSCRSRPENGAFYQDGALYLSRNGRAEKVMEAGEIRIPGMHNVENYMAALCAVSRYVQPETVRQVAIEFAGVEHRIELARRLDGVDYYNDAIATSPARAIAGFRAFDQKLIVIAGGYDKKIPFEEYGREACRHVKLLILNGATAAKLRQAVESAPEYPGCGIEIEERDTLEQAVALAHERAQPGEIVTLSPACASFDAYPNFMVKGRAYKELVQKL